MFFFAGRVCPQASQTCRDIYMTYVSKNSSSHAFPSSCFESFWRFCFIHAANYLNVFIIVRETDELDFTVCLFSSSIKCSFDLRIHRSVLGIRQRFVLKSLTYLFWYINNRKKAFMDRIRLPTANFRLNNRSNQIILLGKVPFVSSSSKSFFHHIS